MTLYGRKQLYGFRHFVDSSIDSFRWPSRAWIQNERVRVLVSRPDCSWHGSHDPVRQKTVVWISTFRRQLNRQLYVAKSPFLLIGVSLDTDQKENSAD